MSTAYAVTITAYAVTITAHAVTTTAYAVAGSPNKNVVVAGVEEKPLLASVSADTLFVKTV